jgi:hypothetical protein
MLKVLMWNLKSQFSCWHVEHGVRVEIQNQQGDEGDSGEEI